MFLELAAHGSGAMKGPADPDFARLPLNAAGLSMTTTGGEYGLRR
jgi:hypothetical protein